MSVLSGYTEALEISRQMLDLAKRQEWESLTQTEQKRSSLLANMAAANLLIPPGDADAIARNIKQIQECDRQILDYVTPWREQAQVLLSRLEPPN